MLKLFRGFCYIVTALFLFGVYHQGWSGVKDSFNQNLAKVRAEKAAKQSRNDLKLVDFN